MENNVFLEDIYPHQTLYGITLRSPVAKGYLKLIDFPKLTTGISIITARNIPGENRLEGTDMPILADTILSYIGQPVAILLCHDRSKLEETFTQCKIIVDEETANFKCNPEDKDSCVAKRSITIGDTTKAFENAHKIVRGSYSTGIQEHWYPEPTGAVCWYEHNEHAEETKEKKLVIRTATQWPSHVKKAVSLMLGDKCPEISLHPTLLYFNMDGKLTYPSLLSCHAALGTFITHKPVRLILTHEEDFYFSPKRSNSLINISSALDEKGKILGTEIDISFNIGAFGINTDEIIDQYCLGSLGFYNINNIKLTASAYKANIPPQGPYCGFGLAQGHFAMERHVSQIADEFNIDPAFWRKQYINANEILPVTTSAKENTDELIDKAAAMSDYNRKWASYELLRASRKDEPAEDKFEARRGIGLAAAFQGSGMLYPDDEPSVIEVTLTKEGELWINYGMAGSNNRFDSIWADLAAQILSIEKKDIHVIPLDSGDSGPSCSSRNITVLTKLAEECCEAIREQRFRDPLPITVRREVKQKKGGMWKGRITGIGGKKFDVTGFLNPGWAAAVVEVMIDPVENKPNVRGIWLCVNGGKIRNEEIARKRLYHSIIQSLGWSLTEHIDYVVGKLTNNMFDNYSIPNPDDIPPVYIEFINTDSPESRGIGELPFSCIPAAFLQAVSQAADTELNSIPVKNRDIWKASKKNNGETPK